MNRNCEHLSVLQSTPLSGHGDMASHSGLYNSLQQMKITTVELFKTMSIYLKMAT